MKLKMEFYVNVQLLNTSKFFTKENKGIVNCGLRNSTLYLDGNPSKIISRSEIKHVFVIKDSSHLIFDKTSEAKDLAYVGISPDTFISIYRNAKQILH